MRFDEVSAEYALFGQFFLAIKLPIDNFPNWLSGKL
jgi:chlorite dismutase